MCANAGHYDQYRMLRKLLESLPWYHVMDLLPHDRIKLLLSDELIKSLRTEQLRKRYEFIRARLQHTV
ncbi:MAG: hypothetical protein LRZ88_02940 [Candidatus Cloacimonetes bacterium]|nr:hypothetical protein [Candidatus Cloacimonadota bacterium]